ncbi:MAG: hypothetical protein GYA86_02185, partial [Firmicutes bacterium]|nr:hypothetical protein [Bacillota bacterium]
MPSAWKIAIQAKDGTLIGHATLEKDPETGMVIARITFDGTDEVFEVLDTVSGGFKASFEYDTDGEAGKPGEHEVMILEKTYIVNVPPAEILYNVNKKGAVNLADRYIEWEIDLVATRDGEHLDLGGYYFADSLGSVGSYLDQTFTVNGIPAAPLVEGNELSYPFPQGSTSPRKITFRTEIPESSYLATSEQRVTNIAQLLDSEEKFIEEGRITVWFTPRWIEKDGTASDSGSGGIYDPTGRTITWTIIANYMEASLKEVVITDLLPAGLELDSAYWQKWDDSGWEDDRTEIAPDAAGEYDIGDIDTRILLTITARVPDEAYTAGITTYKNTATIRWKGLTGTAPGSGREVGLGYNAIGKSGSVKDISRGIISWTVTVDPRGQEIPDLKVYDLLVYGDSTSGFSLSGTAGFPDGLDPQALTPRYDQKYIPGTFTGTDLNLVVHPITRDGKQVADLLEVTEFSTSKQSFTFESQIVNPAIFAGNKGTTLRNNAALYSGSRKLNEAARSVTFTSNSLAKEMLKRGHLADPASGVNDHTTNAAEGFDYRDKSVLFRLSVNADGLDLTNMENAAGELLGEATVIDTLPAGWEFADIVDGAAYLIFAGKKSGDTVEATGEPLAPGDLPGFAAAFDAATHTAAFTFDPLDQPYVILLKARPGSEILHHYFWDGARTTFETTECNTLSLHTDRWPDGISTYRDVTITSRYLDKTYELPEEGAIRWIVDYRPSDLPLGGTKLLDRLAAGVELRTDSSGTLLLGDNITVHEGILQNDGSYSYPEENKVTLVIDDNIAYDRDSRELAFIIPDESKAYRFTYLTDITGENLGNLTISKTVAGNGGDAEKEFEFTVEFTPPEGMPLLYSYTRNDDPE